MDTLRSHAFFRLGLTAALIGTGIYLAPAMFAADGSLFGIDLGINLFQHLSVLFTIILAFAALRIEDWMPRHKLALGIVLGFALLEVLTLGFTIVGIIFLALAILTALLEWPREAAEARTY